MFPSACLLVLSCSRLVQSRLVVYPVSCCHSRLSSCLIFSLFSRLFSTGNKDKPANSEGMTVMSTKAWKTSKRGDEASNASRDFASSRIVSVRLVFSSRRCVSYRCGSSSFVVTYSRIFIVFSHRLASLVSSRLAVSSRCVPRLVFFLSSCLFSHINISSVRIVIIVFLCLCAQRLSLRSSSYSVVSHFSPFVYVYVMCLGVVRVQSFPSVRVSVFLFSSNIRFSFLVHLINRDLLSSSAFVNFFCC